VYANQVGLGSIQAAKEKNIKFIGFSGDQTTIDPNTVVASVVFDFETFYVWAVENFIKGTLSGNTVHEAGLRENIFVPVYTSSIPQSVKDNVQTGIQKALSGEVNLSSLFEKP
jgi:basic membrane protein A